MPDMIRDGTGKGYLAQVDDNNRIHVHSTNSTESKYINKFDKEAYTLPIPNISADASDNCIVYIKNTSSTKDLLIPRIRHRCSGSDTIVKIYINESGTPTGGTTLTPNNRNSSSSLKATGTFYKGSDISGLDNNGDQVGGIFSKDGDTFQEFAPCSDIILGPQGVLTIRVDNATATNFLGIGLFYEEVED